MRIVPKLSVYRLTSNDLMFMFPQPLDVPYLRSGSPSGWFGTVGITFGLGLIGAFHNLFYGRRVVVLSPSFAFAHNGFLARSAAEHVVFANTDMIISVVNYSDVHWTVVIAFLRQKQVVSWDSGTNTPGHFDCRKQFMDYLSGLCSVTFAPSEWCFVSGCSYGPW